MRFLLKILMVCVFSKGLLFAQVGTLRESLQLSSTILKKPVSYSVYLPHDYEKTTRKFPVLFLLHGFTDNETAWIQFGELGRLADNVIASGDATPMIVVMPDAGVSWYMNSADGSMKYEDFFVKELIPYIDKTYRTRAVKESRAIAGLSMGGFGSLLYAIKYPDLFAACVPLSSGVFLQQELLKMDQGTWDEVFGLPYGAALKDSQRFSAHFLENDILTLVEKTNTEVLKKTEYYIDCGDKDFLIKGNMALHSLLIEKEVPHEFRVRNGEHNWTYWRESLPEVLKFVSKYFHR